MSMMAVATIMKTMRMIIRSSNNKTTIFISFDFWFLQRKRKTRP